MNIQVQSCRKRPKMSFSPATLDLSSAMLLYHSVVDSPIGPLTIVVSDRGLHALYFGEEQQDGGVPSSAQCIGEVRRQLREYFAGKRKTFELELDLAGTPFQLKVWNRLLRIPYGATVSYGEIARQIGFPYAARAVGRANGQNPIPIIVPCHRVIGASGALTGYSGRGGLKTKRWLLDFERGSRDLAFPAAARGSASRAL
jgi:methylated-DNA-[protein]-cysteine S-methyltransferase